jgi:hypothetical protein
MSPLFLSTNDGHTGQYEETLTLTNTGTTSLSGTYDAVFSGLPTGVGLGGSTVGPVETTSGLPYIPFSISPDAPLAPGQSMTISVWFSDPKGVAFSPPTVKVYQTA